MEKRYTWLVLYILGCFILSGLSYTTKKLDNGHKGILIFWVIYGIVGILGHFVFKWDTK